MLVKTRLPGDAREVLVYSGMLLAGPIATLLKEDTSIFPPGGHHAHYHEVLNR